MREQTRGECPSFLAEKKEIWTNKWIARSADGKTWSWPSNDKKKINQHLISPLRIQNQRHCSFCDGYPLNVTSLETIEHFRPKGAGLFPELAFDWDNLFYCCQVCQKEKLEKFDEKLLKPDEPDYTFSKYFTFDFTTGEILTNSSATPEFKQRAEVTISLYGLNLAERKLHRLQELRSNRLEEFPLEDLPYRDFLEAAQTA